jgi:hypothetical protein
MLPPKLTHTLHDLIVEEISAVDAPANSQIVNGKKVKRARIVLLKRDDSEQTKYLDRAELRKFMDKTEPRRNAVQTSKEKPVIKQPKLSDVLKADYQYNRQDLENAVRAKAVKLAKNQVLAWQKLRPKFGKKRARMSHGSACAPNRTKPTLCRRLNCCQQKFRLIQPRGGSAGKIEA